MKHKDTDQLRFKYKSPVLSKIGLCYFKFPTNNYFKKDIGPESTSEKVRQHIHNIGRSMGDKRLMNFIAEAVKRR